MKLKGLGALGVATLLFVTACSGSSTPAPATSAAGTPAAGTPAAAGSPAAGTTAIEVGIELPMTGGEAPNGVPTANGVALALSQLSVPGYTITINQQDDAVAGKHDPTQGAKNMQTLANDPKVLFVVGPYNSNVAQAEIPVSNAEGLTQCSPANTNPGLTKAWPGMDPLSLRPTNPTKIAYFRTATTDDLQGAAGADIAFNTVKAKTAVVYNDTQTYGKGLAGVFADDFTKLGGQVLKTEGIPDTTTDFTSFVTALQGLNPQYVFYGGVTTSGIGIFRKQMAGLGLQTIPFGGGDGIVDGPFTTASSFLQVAGAQGDLNTNGTTAGPTTLASDASPSVNDLAAAYKAKFNTTPGAYTAAAYACTQVFLQALQAVGTGVTDMGALREAIRAYVATPTNTYKTALGTFNFDAAGDTSQKIVSYWAYDAATQAWKFIQQRDFTANPFK